MFWIKLKNKNVVVGSESNREFVDYASMSEVEAAAKKASKTTEEYLSQADVLTWIKTKQGIARASVSSPYFVDYATKEEVEKAGGKVSSAHIFEKKKKPGRPAQAES